MKKTYISIILPLFLSSILFSACAKTDIRLFQAKAIKSPETGLSYSVDMMINNTTQKSTVVLIAYGSFLFVYSPSMQQVYGYNEGGSQIYAVQYTFYGNTPELGVIPWTAVPSGVFGSAAINVEPYTQLYFTSTGLFDKNYDVAAVNAHFLFQDITLSALGSEDIFGYDMNNQRLPNNYNLIRMSCLTSSPSGTVAPYTFKTKKGVKMK